MRKVGWEVVELGWGYTAETQRSLSDAKVFWEKEEGPLIFANGRSSFLVEGRFVWLVGNRGRRRRTQNFGCGGVIEERGSAKALRREVGKVLGLG